MCVKTYITQNIKLKYAIRKEDAIKHYLLNFDGKFLPPEEFKNFSIDVKKHSSFIFPEDYSLKDVIDMIKRPENSEFFILSETLRAKDKSTAFQQFVDKIMSFSEDNLITHFFILISSGEIGVPILKKLRAENRYPKDDSLFFTKENVPEDNFPKFPVAYAMMMR